MKLSAAWAAFEMDKRLEGYSEKTLEAYKIQQKLLIDHFGDVEIESLTLNDFRSYLSGLSHLKPGSVAHRIKFIRSLYKWAHEEEIILRNPTLKLRTPKMGQVIPKSLPEEAIEDLRIACNNHLERALLETFYTTGCRISELEYVNRDTINWDGRSFVVVGKGGKEREVYFTTRCAVYLKRYLHKRKDNCPALFATERRHPAGTEPKRLSTHQMRYVIKRIAKNALLKKRVYPHRLRHSYATHLMDNDAPIHLIQSLLGHSSVATTQVYAQLSGEKRREQYRRHFNR